MILLKSVDSKAPLFPILYDASVLVQVWKFLRFHEVNAKNFLLLVRSKLDEDILMEVYFAMKKQAQPGNICQPPEPYNIVDYIGHPRFGSTPEPSAHQRTCSLKDHDTEERAQMPDNANEDKVCREMAEWTKDTFGSVWSKSSVD